MASVHSDSDPPTRWEYPHLVIKDACPCLACVAVRRQERRLARLLAIAGRTRQRERCWAAIRLAKRDRDEAMGEALRAHSHTGGQYHCDGASQVGGE